MTTRARNTDLLPAERLSPTGENVVDVAKASAVKQSKRQTANAVDKAPDKHGDIGEPDLKELVAEALLLKRMKDHIAKRDAKKK